MQEYVGIPPVQQGINENTSLFLYINLFSNFSEDDCQGRGLGNDRTRNSLCNSKFEIPPVEQGINKNTFLCLYINVFQFYMPE